MNQHTRWQSFLRDIFRMLGPAQTGLPPYATPEEREAWRRANAPLPPPRPSEQLVPAGYRIEQYTDGSGVVHRSIVKVSEDAPERRPAQD